MGERVKAGDVELCVERHGQGPDVLLIAGLGDAAEAWQPQLEALADRYRITAFDNPGAGAHAAARAAAVVVHDRR
jgi:pimeloyl-ACP methyl ester carboxylesterase